MSSFMKGPANNMCRVFEMPNKFPSEFCNNGGIPAVFMMVDWFNSWPTGMEFETRGDFERFVIDFLMQKHYIVQGKQYLVIAAFGISFTFRG